MLRVWKKSWEPFRSCLSNSTANPAHFHPNWVGLTVLFKGSQDFFRFNILIFIDLLEYKTIETHARYILPLNISAVGSLYSFFHGQAGFQFHSFWNEKRNDEQTKYHLSTWTIAGINNLATTVKSITSNWATNETIDIPAQKLTSKSVIFRLSKWCWQPGNVVPVWLNKTVGRSK